MNENIGMLIVIGLMILVSIFAAIYMVTSLVKKQNKMSKQLNSIDREIQKNRDKL